MIEHDADENRLIAIIATGIISPKLAGKDRPITVYLNDGRVVHADYYEDEPPNIFTAGKFFSRDSMPALKRWIRRLLKNGESFKVETGHEGRLGKLRWSISRS